MSFEVDELVPVSKYWEGGYSSPEACALDIANCKPAHRICNQRRGNDRPEVVKETEKLSLPLSQEW